MPTIVTQPPSTTDDVPGADDRKRGDIPGRLASAEVLFALWRERDAEYAKRDRPLTDEQIEALRANRLAEVSDLPPTERARAYGRAKAWYPPEHGQGRFLVRPKVAA